MKEQTGKNPPCGVEQSNVLYARAKAVVPGGLYGHFGSAVRPDGPKFFGSSAGSRFVDVDGNEYVDYVCGYGPNILGYDHPTVEAAVQREQRLGGAVSLASPLLVELAERLVETVAIADWAVFGKNGTDSTGLAAMIARGRRPAATGFSRSKAATTASRRGCRQDAPAPLRRMAKAC